MILNKLPLNRCAEACGVVIVIDVLRAFSTAAYAFSRGAEIIYPVALVEEAFALKKEHPEFLLMGEENWFPVAGFDFSNSPMELEKAELMGHSLVQRTSAGTQGLMRVSGAEAVFAASFVNARATAEAIRRKRANEMSFILTGTGHGNRAQEDEACADYISAFLLGEKPNAEDYLRRVADSDAGRQFLDPTDAHYAPHDMELCARADIFSFAMELTIYEGKNALRRVDAPNT